MSISFVDYYRANYPHAWALLEQRGPVFREDMTLKQVEEVTAKLWDLENSYLSGVGHAFKMLHEMKEGNA